MSDFRYALRQLGRRRGFTALVILTLALGIGATTAVFSVVNSVLIQPLPYPDAERLIGVWHRATFQGVTNVNTELSPPIYFAYAEHNETLEQFGVWRAVSANVTGLDIPEQVSAFVTTHGVLPALGVQPALGRWFSPEDDELGTPETIILTHAYWQSRLGGDPAVLGRVLNVDSRPREIIGVMPRGFGWNDAQLILPMRFDPGAVRPDMMGYFGVARLRPGVALAEVNGDLARALLAGAEEFDLSGLVELLQFAPAVRPLKQDFVGDVANVLWMLLGAVGLVLLIACANVANLLLIRADGRSDELAVRTALGASQRRIARSLLHESVVLGCAGGVVGLAIAFGALRLLLALGPAGLPRLTEITLDGQALAFTLAVALTSGLLFGLVPAVRYGGSRLPAGLATGGRAASPSRERHRAQSTLVVSQFALAFVLLIAAGLMIRSFQTLLGVEPGFARPEQVQALRVMISAAEVPELERVIRLQNDMLDRLAAIPGVESVAFAAALPMESEVPSNMPIAAEGITPEDEFPGLRRTKTVSPAYFSTLGVPLLAGRDFSWSDVYDQREVAIVSARMARETWGDPAAAVGKRIRIGFAQWREVVGVAADVHDEGTSRAAPAMVYWRAGIDHVLGPAAPAQVRRQITFAIRTDRAGTDALLAEAQNAIWSVDRNVPLASVRTLEDIYESSLATTSFTLVMLGIAGALALALGVVGIYGVVAYTVARRSREIGLRLALGARARDVQRLFVGHGLLLASVGVTLGVGAALVLTRLMSSSLFGVSPVDPATFVAGALVLLGAAMMASYLPVRGALAADPVATLKAD